MYIKLLKSKQNLRRLDYYLILVYQFGMRKILLFWIIFHAHLVHSAPDKVHTQAPVWNSSHCRQLLLLGQFPLIEFNLVGLGLPDTSLGEIRSGFTKLLEDPGYEDRYDVRNGGTPFRRRSMATFILTHDSTQRPWQIDLVPNENFTQGSSDPYLANTSRKFEPSPEEFVSNPVLSQLLTALADRVNSIELEKVRELKIVVHQTVVIASSDGKASNSPEGVHRDGFDFLVPALVIERKNIVGGETRFFEEDKKSIILGRILEPGEGHLFKEGGSSVWHDSTPIVPIDLSSVGYRSSLGIDITISERFEGP